ncbi:MAG: hypothetical protein AAFY88_20740, partial [Acidobacteriota bacterium]
SDAPERFFYLSSAHRELGSTYPSEGRMSTADLDRFASAVAGGDRRLMLQTNVFGTNSPNTPARNPPGRTPSAAYAGDWAAWVGARGIPADFEIGNEPEHFVKADGAFSPWFWLGDYIEAFRDQAREIRLRHSSGDLRVFGPATNIGASSGRANVLATNHLDTRAPKRSDGLPLGFRDGAFGDGSGDDFGWRVLDFWLRRTASAPASERPDGISIHYYPGTRASAANGERADDGGDGFSWRTQRSAAQAFVYHFERVSELSEHWYGRRLPVVVSEWHSGLVATNEHRQSQSGSLGAALQQLDTVATFAQVGVESHAFYSVHEVGPRKPFWWRTDADDSYGMLTGLLDQHQTATSVSARAPNTPTPTYFTMAMWGKLMGDHVLARPTRLGSFEEQEVSTYATVDDEGDVQVLIINKTSAAAPVRIDFLDSHEKKYSEAKATWISPGAPANDQNILQTRGWMMNGRLQLLSNLSLPEPVRFPGDVDGYWFFHEVPAYTAIVFEFAPEPRGTLQVDDCQVLGQCEEECGDVEGPCIGPGA